jgi:N-dimethylarginine dimethylaminohydrolase
MIRSNNEWDTLKEVVVGSATNAHWPVLCHTFRKQEVLTSWKESPVPAGPVQNYIIDEANEDLDNFTAVLTNLGITVYRPCDLDFQSFDGMYNYCPRDRVLIVGDTVIDAPMLYPTRKKEIDALSSFIGDPISCNDPNIVFDAANICRLGNDLLYLVSESGNYEGARWLQDTLGGQYQVHILDNIYNGVHIDSTISPIREGLVVLNADRINNNNLPTIFESWDKIWIAGDDIIPQSFVNYPYASKYIALNFLTINSNLVICDPFQTHLRKQLEKYQVDSIGVDLRHSRTLGGGHHCVTLDLMRLH